MGKKIGFIGAGNMAEAIIGAVVQSGLFAPENLSASDIRPERLDELKKIYGITISRDNTALFATSDILFLSVKPQQMSQVLTGIATDTAYRIPHRKLVISIAAGIKIEKIESILYAPLAPEDRSNLPIIRVMPNTPALIRKAMSGMSPNKNATTEDLDTARTLLSAMGKVIEFPESDLDAVTALSGSGPAYVFFLAESIIAAGLRLGLSPEDAKTLAITTIEGAAALMSRGEDSPESLRARVTSPGGTTEAAIGHLTLNRVRDHIVDAILAAADRSRELSG
jgi:pyrroline-5-carboxylate reductase